MPVHAASNEHPYAPPLRLKELRPVQERPQEAAARAMPPAPPLPQPIINSLGERLGSVINMTA